MSLSGIGHTLLPAEQRRSIDDLTSDLDPASGDVSSKRSAFWILLALSALIASAGVLADSTATVIGAMIIAPLSTPIMGVALGLVTRRIGPAALQVVLGATFVVLVGVLFSALLPGVYDVRENSQIIGRTSPGVLDLLAALATGLAGAIGLARRDVAAVLPGVAIAISLVPPLAVVGVCLGQGEAEMALGALLLFGSNLVSMVTVGTTVFAALAYTETREHPRTSARARVLLLVVLVAVAVPLVVNTLVTIQVSVWTSRVQTQAQEWIADVPGAEVTDVTNQGRTFTIRVHTAEELPPLDDLMTGLRSEVPSQVRIVVETTEGEVVDVGEVGSAS